ncbi:TPA: phosphate ABC transporter permease subunit PstC [candidate division WOR-3 bacterium]|jgi:phosphate transport system permease protein|uniref:Phosphate transport system permease protein n=1 Tax=candidate division WOR-3 bacterium TaxID=2052148 RepID=A0A350HA58_UNCW3|nr:phosphate ABC transporter permease subunit PstC [candidate division WOR-3 bacterium]
MKTKEFLFKYITLAAASLSILFLMGIILSIFKEGLPLFNDINFSDFIFGRKWHPTDEPADLGIFPLISGSIFVTLGALLVGVPLGVGSAIYLSEIASTNVREALKPFIEILAGIPSVIYGLFGMAVLAPLVRKLFNVPTGLNLFSASIILGIMIIPIISSLSEDALSAVSKELREASLALGANRIETIFKVVLPAASSGVISSIILGFGRAIGETMVVLMVSGGAAMLPKSIFSPVRPMTSAIASEMGEAVNGSQHFQALYGIAIVLFLITFLSSLLMQWFAGRENRE